ncbi:MAG: hypothetical protein AAF639_04795 [Chloroflexota bacterium]
MSKIIAVLALGIAGAIHIYISPSHFAHAPAHGIFFAVSGILQVSWALILLIRSTRFTYFVGFGLSGGLIILWLFTQIWTPPFASAAEPVDVWMISSKVLELVAAVALYLRAKVSTHEGMSHPSAGGIGDAIVASLVAGALFYGAGYVAEPMLPMLNHMADDGHHEEMGDGHGNDAHEDDGHGHD